MTTPSYITAQDLADELSEPTYMAIFDDTNVNDRSTVDTSTAVLTVLRRSLVWVSSWLPDIYRTLPPETGAAGVPTGNDSIPAIFKDACLQYAAILSYRRHPEYVKTYGASPDGPLMQGLTDMMQRIQDGTQRVTTNDSPPEAKPRNVGGAGVDGASRIITDSPDGTTNSGDF